MNKTAFFLILIVAFACKKEEKPQQSIAAKTPVELGREIFEDQCNCAACHLPNQKVVGPSILEIAQIYKEKKANMAGFLKGNEKPIVDPDQYDVMEANFAITKLMTDEELHAVEAYMNSFLK